MRLLLQLQFSVALRVVQQPNIHGIHNNMKLKDKCSDQWFFGGKRERDTGNPPPCQRSSICKKNPLLRKLIDKLMITKEMQGNLQHVSNRSAS